jgi:hypothetical protein
MWLGLPHPSILGIPWCVCTHPINPMGIHFLRCVHGNKCTGIHNAIRDNFAVITQDANFHVGREQLHALPSTTFNSSCQWVDIVFNKDGICTLVDVVIANPTWTNLFPQSCAIQGFVAFDATQAKERSYCNWHPIDQFLPLAIDVFGCLHKDVDIFLHDCANAIWSLKAKRAFIFLLWSPFFINCFYHITKDASVFHLKSGGIVGLATSQLPPLQNTSPITTTHLLQVVDFLHINMADLLIMDMERFS